MTNLGKLKKLQNQIMKKADLKKKKNSSSKEQETWLISEITDDVIN